MSDTPARSIRTLSAFHDVPYTMIEGLHVVVRVQTTDHAKPLSERPEEPPTEVREGVVVGRGSGRGVSYDSGEKAVTEISIGPSIYLDTPEDTILEVRTDKPGNELVEARPPYMEDDSP